MNESANSWKMIVTNGIAKRPSIIQVDGFGFMPGDYREIVRRYTITNGSNTSVRLISLGAGIQSIIIPNKNNDLTDVVLGFDNVSGYLKNRYIGRIINRSSNPFARTSSAVGNNLDIVNWDSYVIGDRVVMTRVSRPDEGCSAGYSMTQVSYGWSDDNELSVEIRATSTKSTRVDIASYCLFNLAGHGMGAKELKRHVVTINAIERMELDVAKDVATGRIEDFNELSHPTRLSSRELFRIPGGGYNHHFCVASPSDSWTYRFHARMLHPASGRSLEICSNHPSLQLYTGNHLPDPNKSERGLAGKNGMFYARHGCFALVPQGYPRALCPTNRFPSDVLRPGKIYVHDMTYHFGVK